MMSVVQLIHHRDGSENKFLMNFGNDSQLFQEEQDVHNFLSELKIRKSFN